MKTKVPTRSPPRWRRRVGVVLALFATVAAGIWWSVLRPRDDYFAGRNGSVVSAEVGQVEAVAPGFVSRSVRLVSSSGLEVRLRVLRPRDSNGPRPLVILLAGHRTGRDAVELLGAPGDMVVAALDYPYDGPDRLSGVGQSLAAVPVIRRALLDTPPAVLLALGWLMEQPEVDPSRVELVGVSLGVPFAVVAGALDERFRRVWLIHGGADNERWIGHNLGRKIESETLRGGAAWVLNLLAHGTTWRTSEWVGRIAPRPVVIIGGREDRRLPGELVEQLHAAAAEPKELIWIDGGHVDRKPEVVRRLLGIVRERVLAEP